MPNDITQHDDFDSDHDDHFTAQAVAFFRSWAATQRDLKTAREDVAFRERDLAIAGARIIELERTNAQLNERIAESMAREAASHAEAARLGGIMQVTGLSLANGQARPQPTLGRPRTVS